MRVKKYLHNRNYTSKLKWNEEINSICKLLEETSGLPTDAHIYFSKKTGESFTPHKDNSDNFIIQVEIIIKK